MSIKRVLIGDTVRITWISSDITPSVITSAIFTGSETIVSSVSMSSSGNGHYFHDYTLPDTPGFYVSETLATVNGNPYKRRTRFQVILAEVD